MNTHQLVHNPPDIQMNQSQPDMYEQPVYGQQIPVYGQQQMYPQPQMYTPPEQPVYQPPMAQPESGKKSMSSSEERKEAAQFICANIFLVLGLFIPFLQCINCLCIFSKPRSDRVASTRTFMSILSVIFGFFQFFFCGIALYLIIFFSVLIPSTRNF